MIALYIFILIHPCYIYFFIDFIALYYVSCFHAASSMPWYLSFMYAYIVLYAFKYLYDDTYARTYILYIFTYLIYAFMSHDCTIFLSHYTNYLIVFVLSRDIFYLCSIYTAKITEFVQRIICKRTKEKAWRILQTFCIYYITIQILYLKIAFLSILFVLFYVFIYSSILATSDFVAMKAFI